MKTTELERKGINFAMLYCIPSQKTVIESVNYWDGNEETSVFENAWRSLI